MYKLVCCRADKETSIDLDEQERVMRYSGLGSFINTFDNESSTSRVDGCGTDSMDEVRSSCSSSKDGFGSFSSQWLINRQEDQALRDEWEFINSPQPFYAKESRAYTMQFSDVDSMKERFAKLLLGEDVSGGSKGIGTSVALSNAITNLAASVFGEFWKLEPLSEERKNKWQREMDWFLSPANYMVELVPAKQNGSNGRCMEIMTPRTRNDIHMTLPALQKLDSMLMETLESVVNIEFWYVEGGSKGEESRSKSARQSRRWWLPSPRVPASGLSGGARKKLVLQAKFVHQIFKACKSINEQILMEMPVPQVTMDCIPKSGKANLGEDLYRAIAIDSSSIEHIMNSLDLKTEHSALEIVNRLEGALLAWKHKISTDNDGKLPMRNSWSLVRDSEAEVERIEECLQRAQAVLRHVKMRFPSLPQTFLGITKVQYNKDIGHSILEAYSRVLGNLAFSILARISDVLQEDEDHISKPETPITVLKIDFLPGQISTPASETPAGCVRHSLVDYTNKEVSSNPAGYNASVEEIPGNIAGSNTVTPSPHKIRSWCYGKESCSSVSPSNSP